ncbi:hypothetical protein V8C86DRAFT_1023658 [Haematococcus lacustris]
MPSEQLLPSPTLREAAQWPNSHPTSTKCEIQVSSAGSSEAAGMQQQQQQPLPPPDPLNPPGTLDTTLLNPCALGSSGGSPPHLHHPSASPLPGPDPPPGHPGSLHSRPRLSWAGQLDRLAAEHLEGVPLPLLLPALQVLSSMARALPAALASSCEGAVGAAVGLGVGGDQEGHERREEGGKQARWQRPVTLLHHLLQQHQAVFDQPASSLPCCLGLVLPSPTWKPRGTFRPAAAHLSPTSPLPGGSLDPTATPACIRAGMLPGSPSPPAWSSKHAAHSMHVLPPACFGLVESGGLAEGCWLAAVTMMLQMLRLDGPVLTARSKGQGAGELVRRAPLPHRQRATKGLAVHNCGSGSESSSEEGGEEGDSDSAESSGGRR